MSSKFEPIPHSHHTFASDQFSALETHLIVSHCVDALELKQIFKFADLVTVHEDEHDTMGYKEEKLHVHKNSFTAITLGNHLVSCHGFPLNCVSSLPRIRLDVIHDREHGVRLVHFEDYATVDQSLGEYATAP